MHKLLVLFAFLLAFTTQAQTRSARKSYGFTHTIRLKGNSQAYLLEAVDNWINTKLRDPEFHRRGIDREEAYITGTGKQSTPSGTSSYDLTFYVERNVVDVIADNVRHSKEGRAARGERGAGTLRKKTKKHLDLLSRDLRQYLNQLPPEATVRKD
ncbi:MAG: hypothetical protein ACO1O1_05225 [Adhaeribacter sp.]